MKTNQRLGALGEEVAKRALKKRGFRIVKSNFKGKGFEIDIIARKADCLYFFEVKTSLLKSDSQEVDAFSPLDRIDSSKINRLYRGYKAFLQKSKLFKNNVGIRFGFVGVMIFLDRKKIKVKMLIQPE